MWWVGLALAREIVITPNGTNDALQNALKVARSGDIIALKEGLFRECVTIENRDIALVGRGGKLIGNGHCAAVLTTANAELTIRNLTISHRGKRCVVVRGRRSTLFGHRYPHGLWFQQD